MISSCISGKPELCCNNSRSSSTAHQYADAAAAVANDPVDELSETEAVAVANDPAVELSDTEATAVANDSSDPVLIVTCHILMNM